MSIPAIDIKRAKGDSTEQKGQARQRE